MNIVAFVHEGLGNSSYLVELSNGVAALVDPDRSVERYLRAAEERRWKIGYVLETHLHADFVTGALEAAQATEATLLVPAMGKVRFPHRAIGAGERLRIEGVELEPIASAGHTPEHLSYVLRNGSRAPSLFSGGSLIVGGAARTDLISPEMTETLTLAQYHTIKEAFSELPDETSLLPTHGGGSFCAVGGATSRTSTLGEERSQNVLFQIPNEEIFLRWFPTTFAAAPDYFFRLREVNQQGPRPRSEIKAPVPLAPIEFEVARREALVVDVRPRDEYAAGHIPGSLSNPLRDAYSLWLGWLVPPEKRLLFVLGEAPLEHVVDESLLVGHEHFAGWLAGGVEAWKSAGQPIERTALVDAHAAKKALLDGAVALDVREPDEYQHGHIEGALHLPLSKLSQELGKVPKDQPILAYCSVGDRASGAISLLEKAGFGPLLNLDGGFSAWKDAGYSIE